MITRIRRNPWPFMAAAVLALAGLFSWRFGPAVFTALLVSAAAILANGVIATVEDDLPGGFNNPDGATTPSLRRTGQIVRWTLGLLSCLTASVLVLFRSPGGPITTTLVLIAAGIFIIGIALISRSKPIQIFGFALLIVSIAAAIVQQPASRP